MCLMAGFALAVRYWAQHYMVVQLRLLQSYLPTGQPLDAIIDQFDQSRPSIGKVQYYFSHSVTLTHNQAQITRNMQYTFAYVHFNGISSSV